MPTTFRYEFTVQAITIYIAFVLTRLMCKSQLLLDAVEMLRLNAKNEIIVGVAQGIKSMLHLIGNLNLIKYGVILLIILICVWSTALVEKIADYIQDKYNKNK